VKPKDRHITADELRERLADLRTEVRAIRGLLAALDAAESPRKTNQQHRKKAG
jgi:hypothetical protein